MKRTVGVLLLMGVSIFSFAKGKKKNTDGYWQQHVSYKMEIDMDVNTNRFTGHQELIYTNNSPDTLHQVFYHLYYNAFQPGSMMDVRSRSIADPDPRVQDRIYDLKPDEIGYQKIKSLKQKSADVQFKMEGTILQVSLNEPILPGKSTTFIMDFEAQVPIQIRRTGRDNKEGVRYSMTQWYPKMCEYDVDGWTSNPYVGREFHGVWGDFDVTINIDKSYVLGGTGYLQNPQEVGCGYEDPAKPLKETEGDKKSWHFKAETVHDFAWAADPDFKHTTATLNNGTVLHFIYQTDTISLEKNWKKLPEYAVRSFEYMNENFGEYPYKQYSIIQGGDGGMEYPMCTLITAEGSFSGLVSVTVHESIHSWFQGLLATNESKFEWMDEGFCTYAQYKTMDYLFDKKALNPWARNYAGYIRLANSDKAEPLTTHADFYKYNYVYGTNAYSKGAVLVAQLGYVIGEEALVKGMKMYFNEWHFKHPRPINFKRIMEKVSGLELDWYFEQFVETINKIDYKIAEVEEKESVTKVKLERVEDMPMPIDLVVTLKNGKKVWYYIPLRIMRGAKINDVYAIDRKDQQDWPWVYPYYELTLPYALDQIEKIEIDPSTRMADVDRSNNSYPFKEKTGITVGEK